MPNTYNTYGEIIDILNDLVQRLKGRSISQKRAIDHLSIFVFTTIDEKWRAVE